MITTILFDLDDTILDFKKAEEVALRKTLISFGITPTKEIIELYSRINKSYWQLLEQGKATREQILNERFSDLFKQINVDCDGIVAKETYENLLQCGHYFIPNAFEVIKELYSKYNLYIASNGTTKVQEKRIESAGIKPYFKDIFISQNIGFNKPNKKFFEYCFNKIPNFANESTIIIGDSLTSDIRGGNNAKIKTCWFNAKNEINTIDVKVDYEIKSLKEIPKLIEKINLCQTDL